MLPLLPLFLLFLLLPLVLTTFPGMPCLLLLVL